MGVTWSNVYDVDMLQLQLQKSFQTMLWDWDMLLKKDLQQIMHLTHWSSDVQTKVKELTKLEITCTHSAQDVQELTWNISMDALTPWMQNDSGDLPEFTSSRLSRLQHLT